MAEGIQPRKVARLYHLAPSRSTAVAREGVETEEDEATATTRIDVSAHEDLFQGLAPAQAVERRFPWAVHSIDEDQRLFVLYCQMQRLGLCPRRPTGLEAN